MKYIRFLSAALLISALSITALSISAQDATPVATAEATSAEQPFTLLNLNDVTAEQLLATIPDMSDRMTREFAEYLPYTSIGQFNKEIGKYVGDDQVAIYKQYVYVPVSPNDADAATIEQIPGVTEDIANSLIAARPYATPEDFVTALAAALTPEQAAYGANFVEGYVKPFTLLNLNDVTKEQLLATIPDMSDRMTREFAEYLPYTSIGQFNKEIGKYVGDEQVAAYKQYVYVPVSPNDADAATIEQIPGVTEDIANSLIAARPYATPDDFVTALGTYLTPAQAAYGANFVEGYVAPIATPEAK